MKRVVCLFMVLFVVFVSHASWFSKCVLKGKFGYCTRCANYTVLCPCNNGKPRCSPYCEECGSGRYVKIFTGSEAERLTCMKRLRREVGHYKQLLQEVERKGDTEKAKKYKWEIETRQEAIAEIKKDLGL